MNSLLPPSTLLMGPAGVGKTTAIKTLLQEGLFGAMLATEPTAPNRVIEECKKANIDYSRFHWRFVPPSMPQWASLIDSAEKVNSLDLKSLSDIKGGIAKQDGKQYIEFLKSIQNFRSDRDGKELGDVTDLGPEWFFVIDGLTGLSTMSRNLTVGLKPNPSPGEWGVMQSNILTLIQKLTADCKCFFVCISHVERESNELSGLSNITVSTLGTKLAPKLPPMFTNVVYAKRLGPKFVWSTADSGVDTKNGDLPLSDSLDPSFKPIVDSFRARLKAVALPAPVT